MKTKRMVTFIFFVVMMICAFVTAFMLLTDQAIIFAMLTIGFAIEIRYSDLKELIKPEMK